ncbi:MAG: hypothetical protein V7638_1888 [Acidobacteriota bacterium]
MQLPISTAWMYLSDDQHYNTIPPQWSNINFKDVDVLNIGPGGVQADGTFGLYNTPATGDLAKRFKWVMQTARSQNPNIKIIVSQWWGNGTNIWGSALDTLSGADAICTYTDSVIAFLASYLGVSGGIDGYDIDYESNNAVKSVTEICSHVRSGMDTLSEKHGGRQFYLTVSPADLDYLDTLTDSVNLVNMQTYAGGKNLTPGDFTRLGYPSDQLLYGICPETKCSTRTVAEVESEYTKNNLAGVHLWRLNSDNYVQEGEVQAQIYAFLHP